jgi:predicted HTH domain antitoxin
MTEVAVSTRISRETKALVEALMREERLDRSAALRKLLHLGADEYRRRKGLEALAAGKASFGEAAEIAGLTLWEFRELVKERKIHWVAGAVVKDVQKRLGGR